MKCISQFYNRISIDKVKVTNGVAEVLAMETMSVLHTWQKTGLTLACHVFALEKSLEPYSVQ